MILYNDFKPQNHKQTHGESSAFPKNLGQLQSKFRIQKHRTTDKREELN